MVGGSSIRYRSLPLESACPWRPLASCTGRRASPATTSPSRHHKQPAGFDQTNGSASQPEAGIMGIMGSSGEFRRALVCSPEGKWFEIGRGRVVPTLGGVANPIGDPGVGGVPTGAACSYGGSRSTLIATTSHCIGSGQCRVSGGTGNQGEA